ncbi:T9SS type A sorting domain-containing protein [Owenweeksia hongkongensis]|uniref:T9SS type A sorting domain-containing protein n=1 Tax=Owenweeksia hongkongensis TaxID=253245 RepID=UPI003A907FE5
MESFLTLQARTSGTLFFVVDLDTIVEKEQTLLRVGPITVLPDQVFAYGAKMQYENLEKNPRILRISYQGKRSFLNQAGVLFEPKLKLAEIIYFSETLSETQSRIVETYLALKYSINITANDDDELRNYITAEEDKVWSITQDVIYDQEVLCLGRIDSLSWYQTKTFSDDSESIMMSLDSTDELGEMPTVSIENNSMVLFVKRNESFPEQGCSGDQKNQPWKIKFFNWKSSANIVNFKLEGESIVGYKPYLIDGVDSIPVGVKQEMNGICLTIPIPDSVNHKTYYLTWLDTNEGCKSNCAATLTSCLDPIQNQIIIEIDEEALPADVLLIGANQGEIINRRLSSFRMTFEDLQVDQYHLIIKNDQRVLLERVLRVEQCLHSLESRKMSDSAIASREINQRGQLLSVDSLNKSSLYWFMQTTEDLTPSIDAFPNPTRGGKKVTFGFNKLDLVSFKVEIIDGAGGLLERFEHSVTRENRVLKLSFPADGVYMVRFISPDFFEIKTIVIN